MTVSKTLIALGTALTATSASAATLATYADGTDSPNNGATVAASAPNLAAASADYSASALTRDAGLVSNQAANPLLRDNFGVTFTTGFAVLGRSNIIDSATPASDQEYITFSLTNDGTQAIDLDNYAFDYFAAVGNAAGSATFTYQLFTAIDGGTFSAVGSPVALNITSPGNTPQQTGVQNAAIDLSAISLGAGQNIEFRLALADNTDTNGFAALTQNLTVTGEVVPEPGSLALIGLGGLALMRRRRA